VYLDSLASFTWCWLQGLYDRLTKGLSVGTHTQMMAHDTSPMDHNTVSGAVHVTSVSVSDARSEVIRIAEITNVLSTGLN
jgi:hypothetical protein